MQTKTIRLNGLTDEQHAEQVQQALGGVWGIRSVDAVSPAKGEVTFSYDEQAASLHDFEQALLDRGFQVLGGVGNHGERV